MNSLVAACVGNRSEGACVCGPEGSGNAGMLRDRLNFLGCGADSTQRLCHYTIN